MFPPAAAAGRDGREAQEKKGQKVKRSKGQKAKRGRATTARIWPCSQNSKACLQAMMGGMDVAAVASPWIMEGWLASLHLAVGTAQSNQPASRFREDEEGAEPQPPATLLRQQGRSEAPRGDGLVTVRQIACQSQCQRGNLTVRAFHPGSSKRNCWHLQGWPRPTTKAPELFGSPMAGAPLAETGKPPGSINATTHHINSPRSIGTRGT